jgi:hypothetical protein
MPQKIRESIRLRRALQEHMSVCASICIKWASFLTRGITITKQRNQLKGDIVKALQCVKCSLHNELIFCEPGPSSLTEEVSEDSKHKTDRLEAEPADDEPEWDTLILEEEDSESDVDSVDDDEVL